MPAKPFSVVKIGGALLGDPAQLDRLWEALRKLREEWSVVVVHGGGPQLTEMARRLGHEPRIVQGRRVTSDLDLNILHWTIRGELNTRLVASAQASGLRAVGISGVDGKTILVEKRPPWKVDGEEVDFGWVGDVRSVDASLVETLIASEFMPIVAPVAVDVAGRTYNVNADTVAQSIARALGARRFYLVTESGGVRRDAADPDSLLRSVSAETYAAGASERWIAGGMLVKLRVAFDALTEGIEEVYVVPPAGITDHTLGTRVVR